MSKAIVSKLYDSDVFRMACRQFDKAADAINLPEALRDRTKYPRRCMAVALPIRRDNGHRGRLRGLPRAAQPVHRPL
jgi:glutamate dehydrogenase (NAD(P)+)